MPIASRLRPPNNRIKLMIEAYPGTSIPLIRVLIIIIIR